MGGGGGAEGDRDENHGEDDARAEEYGDGEERGGLGSEVEHH